MKALVYTAPKKTVYRDEPQPEVRNSEVLVRVDAVGICGSDMHAYLGHDERRNAPLILGHEAAGTVVEGEMEGRLVTVNPLVTCGKCANCLSGRSNICFNRQIISMAPRQGAFAEYISMPASNLVKVPEGMDVNKAALAEPITTAWHAVVKGVSVSKKLLSECRALVIGGGAVGLSAALSLNAKGCTEILLSETNAIRRNTVDKENVCTAFDPVSDDLVDGRSIDLVIDCVGSQHTRRYACEKVAPGGVIVHVGLADNLDGLNIRQLTLQEVTFCGVYTYTHTDFEEAVSSMGRGDLGALTWYEERPLEAGDDAFKSLLDGKVASAKVILKP